jgi:hypothetical protein
MAGLHAPLSTLRCEEHGLAFDDIESITVSVYIEKLLDDGMAKPSVKQHPAAIRMMFDRTVTGGHPSLQPGRGRARPSLCD